jgi:dUTP pyrophosphatase
MEHSSLKQIPEGFYGQIASCSEFALQQYIDVIDKSYNGNVGVILFNHSEKRFVIWHGDSIAKVTFHKCYYPKIEEVERLTLT